jgi:hypothetical protein
VILRRRRLAYSIVLVAACAFAVGGCANRAQVFEDQNRGGWFSQPLNLFSTPEWAKFNAPTPDLEERGPVAPDDLVSADGRCNPPVAKPAEPALAQVAAATPAKPETQADAPAPTPAPTLASSTVGTVAGDLGGEAAPLEAPAPPPNPPPAAAAPPPDRLEPAGLGGGSNLPPVLGGVALGMTECQVVRRAGQPSNVSIGANAKYGRSVTLAYLTGTWPGIYHFADGRLKEIDRAPDAAQPPSKAKKYRAKKKPIRAKTAKGEDVYVQ